MARPAPKAKISVTVAADLVDAVDRGVQRNEFVSRSAAVEAALIRWARLARRRERDREIETYYLGQSDAERAEDAAWAKLAGSAFAEVSGETQRSKGTRRRGRR